VDNEHITRAGEVTGEVGIWAVPRRDYEDDDAPPFRYVLRTGHCYESGAVKVTEHEVTLAVPAGINLVARAIKTLEDERAEALKRYLDVCNEVQAKTQKLLLLSGATQDASALEGHSEVLEI
jgi:hypothetical protein